MGEGLRFLLIPERTIRGGPASVSPPLFLIWTLGKELHNPGSFPPCLIRHQPSPVANGLPRLSGPPLFQTLADSARVQPQSVADIVEGKEIVIVGTNPFFRFQKEPFIGSGRLKEITLKTRNSILQHRQHQRPQGLVL
jgi:hypothetical protein